MSRRLDTGAIGSIVLYRSIAPRNGYRSSRGNSTFPVGEWDLSLAHDTAQEGNQGMDYGQPPGSEWIALPPSTPQLLAW